MSDQNDPGSGTFGMPPTTSEGMPTAPRRPRAGRLRTAAAFGVLGVAVAGTATIVMAASPSPSPSASPGASGLPGTGVPGDGWTGPGGPAGFGGGRGHGDMGHLGGLGGPGGPGGFDQATVSAVSGSTISLKTADGWTRTITITSSTTLTKGGQAITAAAIATGDAVRFSETRNADGSYSITALQVVVPEIDGTVTSVSGSTFQVKDRSGVTWTVTTNGSTTFDLGPSTGSLSDVTVGATVDVSGNQGSNSTVTALTVRVQVPAIVGSVTAKTSTTLTIQRRDGTTATIHLGSATTYLAPNVTTPSLADVTVGSTVAVSATQRADGTFDALQVSVGGSGGPGRWGGPGGDLMPQG